MEKEVRKYYKLKRDLMLMLCSAGVWPNYRKHPKYLRIILSICAGFATGTTVCGIVNYCVSNITNINALTRGMGWFISVTTAFTKVCILRANQKSLQYLDENITAMYEKDLKISEHRRHLLAHWSTFYKIFYSFNYCVAVTILFLLITPLSMIKHGKYIRSFPQKLPFSYEPGGTVHWVLFAYEIICGYYTYSVSVGADNYFGFLAFNFIGELRLLTTRFRNLKPNANYRKDLRECIEKHIILMESHNILQQIFGLLAMIVAITCAVVLCFIVFQTTHESQFTMFKAFMFVFYFIVKMIQAYSYAWYGNTIMSESELCLRSIYDACWPGSGDLRFMNDALIILSQHSLVFSVKGLVIVRLDMFTKIVNTSISYFFLLKTLEES